MTRRRLARLAAVAVLTAVNFGCAGLVVFHELARVKPVAAPRRPDTVAHCLRGELGPGRVSHFEPCALTQQYGRI